MKTGIGNSLSIRNPKMGLGANYGDIDSSYPTF